MELTTFKYQQGFLVVPYMFSMFHNNGVVTKLDGEPIYKLKKFPHMKIMVVYVV
jgi:hypothetical protein